MSTKVLSNFCNNTNRCTPTNSIELLEKCGEVFLEKLLGNYVFLCTLCDDTFSNWEVLSTHITDMHLSIENYLTYESNESEEEQSNIVESTEYDIKTEENVQSCFSFSDESVNPNEDVYNLIDTTQTILDIQMYDENQQEDEISILNQHKVGSTNFTTNTESTPFEVSFLSVSKQIEKTQKLVLEELVDKSDEEILSSKIDCKLCGQQFEYVKQLLEHVCINDNKKNLQYCSVCHKMFKTKSALDTHFALHKEKKPFQCEICGNAYFCKEELTVHIKQHTSENTFECLDQQEVALACDQDNSVNMNDPPLTDSTSQKTFSTNDTVLIKKEDALEKQTAHQSDEEIIHSKIKCKFCGEFFEFVKQLREHDCGLNKKKRLHLCTVCGKVFKKKSGLDTHSLIHKGEKPHKCDICGTAYACKQNLIVHVRRHTGEKPFKCDHCPMKFASSTEKISHMRTHTGERPYICELCGKGHSSSSQLNEHMHRHLDIRNYVCDVCDKRFRNSYNLKMHRLTHEDGPRKFQCEHCLAAFKTQNHLLQHSKIHEKIKKYMCKICGRAFAQHAGLYTHMKTHKVTKTV